MLPPHIEFALPWDLIETQLEHHGTAGAVYYSTGSCWWSHQRGHSMINAGMKCPLGGQIVMEQDWRAWLAAARDNPGHYGQHGLRALLAAHHANCRSAETGGFYAWPTWGPYNAALDALDAELARLTGEKPKPIDLTPKRRPAIIPGPRKVGRRG